MSMISEFKEFALKGNLIDTAIAFIMGGAITPVVMSLVKDIIMPPVGLAMGGVDFSSLKVILKSAVKPEDVVSVNYGNFINQIISFVILSLAIFMLVTFLFERPDHPIVGIRVPGSTARADRLVARRLRQTLGVVAFLQLTGIHCGHGSPIVC